MGRRGPRPLPSAVLEARGSRRAGSRPHEAEAPRGRPVCPAWLSPEAREVWDHMVPILEQMAVLTIADGNALARYCRLFVRWRKAEDFLDQYGDSHPLKDGNGNVKCFMPFPQVGTAAKLAGLLARLEQEFGLTPSARTRVEVDKAFTRNPKVQAFYDRFWGPPRSLSPAADEQRSKK